MVRLDDRLAKIKCQYVDRGKYFVINRGRQYGKTTTLVELAKCLQADYGVLFMDFQLLGEDDFADVEHFVIAFLEYLEELLSEKKELRECVGEESFRNLLSLKDHDRISMSRLFRGLSRMCRDSEKPIVLVIDEVDSASNYRVFLDFLAMLRGYYLSRDSRAAFHSVILAGVYDIKNLKLKLRPEEEHQYNSPWNIAADFNIEMSFTAEQIVEMLEEYETDYHTGMNVQTVAEEIYQYTSGYPYLTSLICKILDEDLPENRELTERCPVWSKEGIVEAAKIILKSNMPLFESMIKQLDTFDDLREMLQGLIYQGRQVIFNPDIRSVNLGVMFGFLKEKSGKVVVSNRIFEMRLLNMFLTEDAVRSEMVSYGEKNKNQFITDNRLNMELILERFVIHFAEIYGEKNEKFVEEYGRRFFLLYLKPIINGVGNYYIEAQTRDAKRTDVIVDYLDEQYIVELKIWHGNEYNEQGRKQLAEYLDYYHQDKGYLLSFNFNKQKKQGVRELRIDGKTIIEAVV